MASIRRRDRSDGTPAYAVLWRQGGKQKTGTFDSGEAAVEFKKHIEMFGPDEALRILAVTEAKPITLTEWCTRHVNSLSGVERATPEKYRSYIANDIALTIGHLPLSAVSEVTISRWVNELDDKGNSAKTIANKHALVASADESAVRAGKISSNPCEHTRLPRRDSEEMVFLEPAEFDRSSRS